MYTKHILDSAVQTAHPTERLPYIPDLAVTTERLPYIPDLAITVRKLPNIENSKGNNHSLKAPWQMPKEIKKIMLDEKL